MVQYSETTMKYELKPLTVGAILDQTILILKDHFVLFLKIMLCLPVPAGLVVNLIMTHNTPMPAANPTPEELAENLQTQFRFIFQTMIPAAVLMVFFVAPLMTGAIIHATTQIYFGRRVTVADAYRVSLKRALPMIWTWILMFLFFAGGSLLCCLPGILAGFWFALASSIVVVERISGFAAIRRSFHLMQASWLEHYLQYFLLNVVIFFIQAGVGVGPAFMMERHLSAIVSALMQAVSAPLGLIWVVVFYFSCRCRAENFDLVQLADEVVKAPPTPTPTQALPG
jgi:hypothetical protein